jgi:putative DNA primase/helicase
MFISEEQKEFNRGNSVGCDVGFSDAKGGAAYGTSIAHNIDDPLSGYTALYVTGYKDGYKEGYNAVPSDSYYGYNSNVTTEEDDFMGYSAGDGITLSSDSYYQTLTEESLVAELVNIKIPNAKRNLVLSKIREIAFSSLYLKVVDGKLYIYNESTGAFRKIRDVQKEFSTLIHREWFDSLSMRDIKEIAEKIVLVPEYTANYDEFNNNNTLINCLNGVLDFGSEKITLNEHSPEYKFSYVIKAKYIENDADIKCPAFDKFCETSLDDNPLKRKTLLTMIGYLLCDNQYGKCAVMLIGKPNTDKSVIVSFVSEFFDRDKLCSIQLHELSEKFNRAELFDRKLNSVAEIKGSKITDITTFKMATSGDITDGQYKGKDPFYFALHCKMLFAGTVLPGTAESDTTRAFAKRLKVLLFNSSIPDSDQDKELPKKLASEIDSIFTLAVRELAELHKREYVFALPQESLDFVENIANPDSTDTANDSVREFIADCCDLGEEYKITNVDLYKAYLGYCSQNCLDPLAKTLFHNLVSAQFEKLKKDRINSEGKIKNTMGYRGIKLK